MASPCVFLVAHCSALCIHRTAAWLFSSGVPLPPPMHAPLPPPSCSGPNLAADCLVGLRDAFCLHLDCTELALLWPCSTLPSHAVAAEAIKSFTPNPIIRFSALRRTTPCGAEPVAVLLTMANGDRVLRPCLGRLVDGRVCRATAPPLCASDAVRLGNREVQGAHALPVCGSNHHPP